MPQRIPLCHLQVGIHVTGIDCSWFRTPFLKHRLLVQTVEQIERWQRSNIPAVDIDPSKGLDGTSFPITDKTLHTMGLLTTQQFNNYFKGENSAVSTFVSCPCSSSWLASTPSTASGTQYEERGMITTINPATLHQPIVALTHDETGRSYGNPLTVDLSMQDQPPMLH
jgi:hypothetical protein